MKMKENDISWESIKHRGNPYLLVTVDTELLRMEQLDQLRPTDAFIPFEYRIKNQQAQLVYSLQGLMSFVDYHKKGLDSADFLWRLHLLLLGFANRETSTALVPLFRLEQVYVDDQRQFHFIGLPLKPEAVRNSWWIGVLGQIEKYQKDIVERRPGRRMGSASENATFLAPEKQPTRPLTPPPVAPPAAPPVAAPVAKPVPTEPLASPPSPGICVGLTCDIGDVKPSNQDRLFVRVGEYAGAAFGVFLVADGMGGLAHGEVASTMVSERIAAWYDDSFVPSLLSNQLSRTLTALDATIDAVNREIIAFSRTQGERIGTTLTLCMVVGDEYVIRHVGDSRVYYDGGGLLTQLTLDHSFVAMELARGNITAEQAKNHPKKNVLTQCIGVQEQVDVFAASGLLQPQQGFLLICSDGFHNYFPWESLPSFLSRYDGQNIQELVQAMREAIPPGGALDNVSCILAKLP